MNEEDRITKAARALADELRASGLISDYKRAAAALDADPALCLRVDEYQRRQAAFERKRRQGGVSFDEEKVISHLYSELSLDETAAEFLRCELRLLRFYKQIADEIGEVVAPVLRREHIVE
jgi:cell fate (sporulation/competence/biofilm development) regulator YlbF (YheA/YmcA/DUF963 family)